MMKNITYISAGAGSGKTYTLTTRLAELIAKGEVLPENVILTTFTIKAANEFRERAKAELYKLGKHDEASRLDSALIGTIDSVAFALVSKYWYTIGLAPKQGIMDDVATKSYINQSIANIPSKEELDFFRNYCELFAAQDFGKNNYNFWKDDLRVIVEKSISFDVNDYTHSMEHSLSVINKICNEQSIVLTSSERISFVEVMLEQTEIAKTSATKQNTLKEIESLKRETKRLNDKGAKATNYDHIRWAMEVNTIIQKGPSSLKKPTDISFFEEKKEKLANVWRSIEVCDEQRRYIKTLFGMADKWKDAYEEYKKMKRIVDFCDMEHYMCKLIEDEEVAAEVGRTYTHLFVDEFQDCSPIQVKIFLRLSQVVKQSFWVGDTKQAIYGFRGSDTALTKAVADTIAAKDNQDNCHLDTLQESWRSVPTLVEFANKAFSKIFSPIISDTKQIVLESAMLNHPDQCKKQIADCAEKPLRYLDIPNSEGRVDKLNMNELALYVKRVIDDEHVQPSDIAILARKRDTLKTIHEKMDEYGIACDMEETFTVSVPACQLMMALITLVSNPNDELAKAQIAHLTSRGMNLSRIIDNRLEYISTPKDQRTSDWLAQTEMIDGVNRLRDEVKEQGIGAMIETLAIELDVKNVMARWNVPLEKSMNALQTMIMVAKDYESRSGEMAQPATPTGFAAFLEQNEVILPTTGNGVLLTTYHGSKGLEWRYVFMVLDDTDTDRAIKGGIFGVNHFHIDAPTANNLFPEMCIRVVPWFFGKLKKMPDCISELFVDTPLWTQLLQQYIEESARLLYVGVTRASEVLTLVPFSKSKRLQWFSNVGLSVADKSSCGDILGVGAPFEIVRALVDMNQEEMIRVSPQPRIYPYKATEKCSAPYRAIQPSGAKGKSNKVDVRLRSEQYIKINASKLAKRPYSEVGDCIHNVFAAIENLDSDETVELIKAHQMSEVIPQVDDVRRAWEVLLTYLKQTYGADGITYHEMPFRQLQDNKQLVVGSIDFVYRTKDGCVLIDFKTFPQTISALNPASEHYVGLYAGQLDVYQSALEAAGMKVLDRLIYYPVTGMLVSVGKAEPYDVN